ncbi:PAS and ANTAR domain-containing protein [Candidatus Mycobacterium wuenschmannii]|uniref:histidine kinase n=1 Tax=Candidatus Mycobacterium wuenschmannii TaxID=3027808 RepID=A0ABY8VY12_9MYCO|nr:PAS and ANTAR domain-containing protein [Candidatus Mycobacterium wuenschmannii]WIM88186.1 PAS and ANTAR domain-containing protein [Candidatus Mycobacterium wuenschmannii]
MAELDGRAVEVGEAFAGAPQRVGTFRFYFEDERWEWSEQVQRMHGYTPGSVTPTTELVLKHKHPDDRRQVKKTIDQMMRNRQAFSTRHRIVDTVGDVHQVVVVGDQLTDDKGVVVGTHGYYVDITPTSDRVREEQITARVAEITEHRAIIEQAKGMLMLVYGLDENAAFDLLRWRSQSSNIKLRRLAEIIVDNFREIRDEAISTRAAFDHALLTGEGTASSAAN